jgi:hypothetical protein
MMNEENKSIDIGDNFNEHQLAAISEGYYESKGVKNSSA